MQACGVVMVALLCNLAIDWTLMVLDGLCATNHAFKVITSHVFFVLTYLWQEKGVVRFISTSIAKAILHNVFKLIT